MSLAAQVSLTIGAAILIALSAVIAAAETAFTRVNRSRADALAAAEAEDHPDDAGDERVEELRTFSRRPLTTLATLALVQLVSQAGAVVLGFLVGRSLAGTTGGIIGAAITLVVLFSAVALSRSRSLLSPDSTAVGLVPLLRAVAPLGWFMSGIVRLASRSSSATIEPDPDVDEQQVLAIVGQAAAIDHDEEKLIKRVVAFDDTVVGDIMTPRTDLVMLRVGFAVGDALEVASLHGLSRIPVTGSGSDIDDVIGAVHVKDLIVAHLDGRTTHDIDRWIRDAPVVPETQRISNLLADLKTGRFHMAIVVDEHGGVAGVVTLEDILEELVGEIEDEFDLNEPIVEMVDELSVRVDGRVEISTIEDALGITLPSGDYQTIAGCFFSRFGRLPDVGDVLTLDEVELEVVGMHGRRISNVLLRLSAPLAVPLRDALAQETAS